LSGLLVRRQVYRTIFDLRSSSPFDWPSILLGAFCIVFLAARLVITRGKKGSDTVLLWVTLAGFGLWTLVVVLMPYYSYHRNIGLYLSGQYHVAEGTVELFQTRADGKDESFILGSHVFDYSCYEDLGRFHMANACGGVVKPGERLRLTYVNDDDIIRVERRF